MSLEQKPGTVLVRWGSQGEDILCVALTQQAVSLVYSLFFLETVSRDQLYGRLDTADTATLFFELSLSLWV